MPPWRKAVKPNVARKFLRDRSYRTRHFGANAKQRMRLNTLLRMKKIVIIVVLRLHAVHSPHATRRIGEVDALQKGKRGRVLLQLRAQRF